MTTIARGSLWLCVLIILCVSGFVLPSITSARINPPDRYKNARVFCKITEKGALQCAAPSDILAAIKESRLETIISQIMAELLAKYPEQDDPFACGDGGMYFVRGSGVTAHAQTAKAVGDCGNQVSGGRLHNQLGAMLEQVLGVQQGQRQATVAYMDKIIGECVDDDDNSGIADDSGDGGVIDTLVNLVKDAVNWVKDKWDDAVSWVTGSDDDKPPPTDTDTEPEPEPKEKDCHGLQGKKRTDCIVNNIAVRNGLEPSDANFRKIYGTINACTGLYSNTTNTFTECAEDLDTCLSYKSFSACKELIGAPEWPAGSMQSYPGPDGITGSSCEQAQARWALFKERCEQSDWQEFHCDQFLRRMNGCVGDPTVTQPPPDQIDMCFSQVSEQEIARERCEEQGGIWSDSGEGTPDCDFITGPIPTFPAYSLCHDPLADLTQDQCAPTIALPLADPVPAPAPAPDPVGTPGGTPAPPGAN